MSARNDGGPAFPFGERRVIESAVPPYEDRVVDGNQPGMTLRDYFAAKGMQAMLCDGAKPAPKICAQYAYEYADAMLAAREAS